MAKKNFIYDTKTKNLSFLQTAKDLQVLGIKNNMFFLKLYDTSIRDLDPHNQFLTADQIVRIINECIVNPWYFLREVAKIPEQGGSPIPYQLNRGNLASAYCFINGIDNYLVLPRQIGKTQSTISIVDWAYILGTTFSEFMFINKGHDDAKANLKRLKVQKECLPAYMQCKLVTDDDGKIVKENDNVETLFNPANGNRIVTKPSARSVDAAENIGRGCTQPIHYYDEVEFTPFIKTIVEAAGPAYNTASENARKNNAAYCRIFTSTPKFMGPYMVTYKGKLH